jgi:hypothetical protein
MKKVFLTLPTLLPFLLLSNVAWSQNTLLEGKNIQPPKNSVQSIPEDLSTVLSAQVDAIKKGLMLTTDQEKLWGPVEHALKTLTLHRKEALLRSKIRSDAHNRQSFVIHMQRTADSFKQSAYDLSELVNALQPLESTMDERQVRRLCLLINPFLGKKDWTCLKNSEKTVRSKEKQTKTRHGKSANTTDFNT